MVSFIAKRLLSSVGVILALIAVVFLLQKVSHTNPVHAYLGPGASQAAIRAETIKLGLNKPLIYQFFNYLNGLVHGNLGISYRTRRPVATDLAQYLPATLELASAALILALGLGFLFGLGAAKQGKIGRIFQGIMVLAASMPGYLVAYGGLVIFYSHLHLIPATGEASPTSSYQTGFVVFDDAFNGDWSGMLSGLDHLILPAIAVALVPAISIGRVFKSALEHTLRADYVRTARSKGLSERRIFLFHALRNSIGPALTMAGLQTGLMFAGVAVIEDIFAWPGIGYYTAQAIPVSDFPAISGVTLVLGIGYIVINTLVDIFQSLADPRIRL
jgi:peptide/nickel transport system permease protein